MQIGSLSEDIKLEKRVAITHEIIKKYKSLGIEVNLPKDYALHLGIGDEDFKSEGAVILNSNEEIISKSNALLQMNIIGDEYLAKLQKNQILIGVLNPYANEKKLKDLSSKNINCFSLEL